MAPNRTVAKLVRFSPEEIARVTERAQICGRTTARYIRETALGALPKARHHADCDVLLRELARVGRDLDRLARFAESAGQERLSSEDRDRLRSALAAHTDALRAIAGERSPQVGGCVIRP